MGVQRHWLQQLQGLMKKVEAQDPATRKEWLQRQLSGLVETSGVAESKPRVQGTRWLPPAEVVAPVLAVHLDRPDRLTADYKRESMREVVSSDHPAVSNEPKSGS